MVPCEQQAQALTRAQLDTASVTSAWFHVSSRPRQEEDQRWTQRLCFQYGSMSAAGSSNDNSKWVCQMASPLCKSAHLPQVSKLACRHPCNVLHAQLALLARKGDFQGRQFQLFVYRQCAICPLQAQQNTVWASGVMLNNWRARGCCPRTTDAKNE